MNEATQTERRNAPGRRRHGVPTRAGLMCAKHADHLPASAPTTEHVVTVVVATGSRHDRMREASMARRA